MKLFLQDCTNLRDRKHSIAADYAAWGAWRVERLEKVEGPRLQGQLAVLDGDIIARVRQLPSNMFLGEPIGKRY